MKNDKYKPWNYNILTQNYFFDAKDYSDYQFGEWYAYFECLYWWVCNYNDNLENSWEFKIDEIENISLVMILSQRFTVRENILF